MSGDVGPDAPGACTVDEVLAALAGVERLVALTRERHRRTASDAPTRLQRFALMMMAEHRTVFLSDLTETLDVGAATMSQLVRGLEDRGWVRRTLDPADRRRHRVALTADGRRIVGEQRERRLGRMRAVLEELTPDERGHLLAIVHKILGIAASRPGLLRDGP